MAHLDEYSDGTTARGRSLREALCSELHIASVEFQTLEGLREAVGIDPDWMCNYCWNGRD